MHSPSHQLICAVLPKKKIRQNTEIKERALCRKRRHGACSFVYCSCIFNRIAIDQLSCDSPPRTSAAALSAAVDSINKQKTAPTLRRNRLRRSTQLKRHLLFGREGSGGRGASLREAASPPRAPHVFLRCMSAAALSAAVDSINKQKTAPTLRRNRLRRSTQLKRHPLFGREGSGGRGASLREAASPPRAPHVPSSFAGIFLRVSNETSYRFG